MRKQNEVTITSEVVEKPRVIMVIVCVCCVCVCVHCTSMYIAVCKVVCYDDIVI